jgi:hypothetical protein
MGLLAGQHSLLEPAEPHRWDNLDFPLMGFIITIQLGLMDLVLLITPLKHKVCVTLLLPQAQEGVAILGKQR